MAGLGAYPASSKPRPGQGPIITPVKWREGEEVIFIVNISSRIRFLKYIHTKVMKVRGVYFSNTQL